MKAPNCTFLLHLVFGVFLAASFPAFSAIFPVIPSGDISGVTDQATIKVALEAAKNGGTVELAAGTFYLHKSIVVFEFSGTFKGAGKALTTVRTAPGINFDLSESVQTFPPPFAYLGASMFSFPYNPSNEARTFVMSDMKIVVSEPGVDSPLDGYEDFRLSYLLNTMHAVAVVNVDVVSILIGQPYSTINLDATVEHLEIEGIQNPKFRGFWDEFLFDTDNSIFDGVFIQGPSVGKAEALDVEVVNADIGIALSDNDEALIESCVVQNAVFGIENWFNANDLIEANSISGDGFVAMGVVTSTNVDISNNFVIGNWVYGINPWLGSNDCTITGNLLGETKVGQKLGMSSIFGAISVEQSDSCTVTDNKFVNVSSPGLGAVWVSGQFNRVEDNDYTESGLPGWNAGPGAIMLARFMGNTFDRGSIKNHVFETQYPAGTDVCEQVQGIQGNNVQALTGGAVTGINQGMCSAVLALEIFNESNASLLQQMAEMQVQREEAWGRSRRAH